MTAMGIYMEGEPVSEEAVAAELGFADIHEFRRWQTAMGSKVRELEHALSLAQNDAENFRRTGLKMAAVLERVIPALQGIIVGTDPKEFDLRKLRLACRVVCGKDVDWDHELKDWGL